MKMLAGMLKRSINSSHNLETLTNRYFSTSVVAGAGAVVSDENPVLVDYLVKSLGFSRDVASLISTNFSLVKSTQKPEHVVDYLKTSGFSKSQIRNLVSFHPRVLFNDVEKTLKPKIRVFESLGISGLDMRDALSSDPRILRRGLTQIVPALEALKSLFTDVDTVFRVVLKSQRILSPTSRVYFTQNVALLESYGVPKERVEKLTVQGNLFMWSNTKWFEKVLKRVEEELHIPRNSSMFVHAVCALTSVTKETINSKLEIYKSFGWREEDFIEMVRRLPYALRMSVDVIRVRLKYFMKELGYEPGYLASHPVLLLLSTEKRVKPRNYVLKVLKEKELLKRDMGLYSFVLGKEKDFVDKYVKPFDKEVPGLYKEYVAMTKCRKRRSSIKDV